MSNTQMYYKTFKNLFVHRDGPLIIIKKQNNYFYLFFDLTSTQQSNQEVYYPEVFGAPRHVDFDFSNATAEPLEFIVLSERFSTIQHDLTGKSVKHG